MREIKVSRGRIQYSRAESVCVHGFRRRAYEALQKMKILGVNAIAFKMRSSIQPRDRKQLLQRAVVLAAFMQ